MPGLDQPLSDEEAAELLAPLRAFAHVALAVSGGPDSCGLMALAARWAGALADAPDITVLTIDHGLRPEAAEEARRVCAQAGRLGLPCHVLRWEGEKPRSGVQAAARAARYDLLGAWCAARGAALVVAHTMEDQAETLLMRLARGSGVDGLAGMAEQGLLPGHPVTLLRPLLGVAKARLAATARAAGLEPVDDPSNSNAAYERVRMRALLEELSAHGLDARALARAARRQRRARAALERWRADFLKAHLACHDPGWGEAALTPLLDLPQEVRLRVLMALAEIFGAGHAPALAAGERLERWLVGGEGAARVLGGARFSRRRASLIIGREPGRLLATARLTEDARSVSWDNRFLITTGGARGEMRVRALKDVSGEGLPERPGDIPAFVWATQPVLCADERVLALPALGWLAEKSGLTMARAEFTGWKRGGFRG